MPADTFTNARPYYDVAFPSSGDSVSIANLRNALQGLGFLDFIIGQPRAHNPANLSIMVRGRDASSFYNQVYAGDADRHIFINSGDSAAMSAPVSNPRLDIVYWTASGDIRIATGAEAATPTLPSLSPSGDTRIPICAIYHKTTETKIVNFEDKDSNTGDGYIYQDLRPFLRAAGLGGTALTSSVALSITGDNAAGTATTAARGDHTHQGIHTIHAPGSGDMFGDIQIAGPPLRQEGNRLTLGGVLQVQTHTFSAQDTANTADHPMFLDNTKPQITEGKEFPISFINVTPKSARSVFLIQVFTIMSTNSGTPIVMALHQDNAADAVAATTHHIGNNVQNYDFCWRVAPNTTNRVQFRLRYGPVSGGNTIYINADASGVQIFGGVAATTVAVTEFAND